MTSFADLWVPVCRIAPPPADRIVLVATTRSDLKACDAGSIWRPANVICALEESLSFLADAKSPRTWARQEYGGVLWMTSRSMAWQGHLVSEHRQWMILGLAFSSALPLVVLAARRTRQAGLWRAACHGDGEPEVPRKAELLLHWVLGHRCRSLPGDLSQEYALMLADGCSRNDADRWYRWQVFHSIAPLTARTVELAFAHGLRRNPFTRRG